MLLKAHRKIIVQAILTGILLAVYDVLLDSLLTLAHIAFEWFELGLEELIEHVFHTTRRQSQIIVFYLLLSVVLFGLYRLWCALPPFYSHLLAARTRYLRQMNRYWQACSFLQKVKLITAGMAGVTGLFFWVFI